MNISLIIEYFEIITCYCGYFMDYDLRKAILVLRQTGEKYARAHARVAALPRARSKHPKTACRNQGVERGPGPYQGLRVRPLS